METLIPTFLLGVGSAASPCLLPLYPGFIAYLAGNRGDVEHRRSAPLLGGAVLTGVLTTMIALAVVLSALAVPLSQVLAVLVPAVDALLLVLGALLITGRNPFGGLAGRSVPFVAHPLAQAYVYGVMLGPVALPCAGPFMIALLAISLGVTDALVRIGGFVVYGLGFGLPLLVLSFVAAARAQAIARFLVEHHALILRAAGVVLVATAVYDVALNWTNLAGFAV